MHTTITIKFEGRDDIVVDHEETDEMPNVDLAIVGWPNDPEPRYEEYAEKVTEVSIAPIDRLESDQCSINVTNPVSGDDPSTITAEYRFPQLDESVEHKLGQSEHPGWSLTVRVKKKTAT